MREIGGYFGLEQLVSNEYYKDLIPLNSGRNALLYILKSRRVKKLYIPYYLCRSVKDMCSRYDYDYEFYNIDEEFMPVFHRELGEDEYLYVVNYYGQMTPVKILNIKKRFLRIILDNVQAFFQKPLGGIDTIYSCRKYFGVPDGAYLSTDCILGMDLDIDISKDRMTHILGRFEGTASDYYTYFMENDASFKSEPLKQMSMLTKNILGAINYNRVKKIRAENFVYLDSRLGKKNRLKLIAPEGPFAYPFYVGNGVKVRNKLAAEKIYIPTLWPNVLDDTRASSTEYDYAANILPVPCDQRYSIDDIKYIVKELLSTTKGGGVYDEYKR